MAELDNRAAPRPGGDAARAGSAPIRIWASLGALSCVLMVVVLARWVHAGVDTLDPGLDEFSDGRLVLLRVIEWSQFVAMLLLFWCYVFRPLVKRQDPGFDGLLVVSAFALNFWDPLDNYSVFSFQYNAHMINVRSWGEYLPGWNSGPDVWVVPIIFVLGAYTWAFFAAARLGDLILTKLTQHRPDWSLPTCFLIMVVPMAAIAAVAENVFLLTRAIANIGTPDALTINGDTYWGWPIYNPLLFGFAYAAIAWLRWTRDKDGLSFVERGVSSLAPSSSARGLALRFLAVFAFTQVAYVVLYFVPWNLFSLLHDPWPALPSYFPAP